MQVKFLFFLRKCAAILPRRRARPRALRQRRLLYGGKADQKRPAAHPQGALPFISGFTTSKNPSPIRQRVYGAERYSAETPKGPPRLSVAGTARSREPTRGQTDRFLTALTAARGSAASASPKKGLPASAVLCPTGNGKRRREIFSRNPEGAPSAERRGHSPLA